MKLGAYELLDVIGVGGMGAVHRAFHEQTGQIVAIKIMAPDLVSSPLMQKRFQQECAAALLLHHPHIVRGYEFGLHHDRPYLVMEFIDGVSLGKHVRSKGPLAESGAIRLALQLADALETAHQHKLVHRDVKPENVLLTPEGNAKLTDLGLIKKLDSDDVLTRPGDWVGTIAFMAPEQFGDADSVDARTDVYGLAATLFFALTGSIPFQGAGNMTMLGKKLKNEVAPVPRLGPSLARRMEVIRAALAADQDCRPRSCKEFAEQFRSVGGDAAPPDVRSRTPDPLPDDRRVSGRFPVILACSCRLLIDKERWSATVEEVSLSGIRLHVNRRFEPGTLLRLELPVRSTSHLAMWVVQVRWVRPLHGRFWVVGCSFTTPLSQEELDAVLGDHPPTLAKEPD